MSTSTSSPTGKTAVICPSILSHPRFLQQIFQTWKFTRLRQSIEYHFYPPHISRASFIRSPPFTISLPWCFQFLILSSCSCILPTLSISSLPTSLPAKKKHHRRRLVTSHRNSESFAFKTLPLLLMPTYSIFLLWDLSVFPCILPFFPCMVTGTTEEIWEDRLGSSQKTGTKITGFRQGIFYFPQPFLLSSESPAASASE